MCKDPTVEKTGTYSVVRSTICFVKKLFMINRITFKVRIRLEYCVKNYIKIFLKVVVRKRINRDRCIINKLLLEEKFLKN